MRPPTPGLAPDSSNKRYGWLRLYEDFVGHGKWRLVSRRAGASICEVMGVVLSLLVAGSRARADGYIGGWDVEVVAITLDLEPQKVTGIYRVLNEIGWLQQDVIVDWLDRNPRDATATQRQRDKRAKDKARRAMAAGWATVEQEALLGDDERQAMERLRKIGGVSRVTEEPTLPLAPVAIRGGRA